MSDDLILEGWIEEEPIWPSQSRLYRLAPIGVGTPLVESLTSYIARLAAAHSVHPRRLLFYEVAPYLHPLLQARTDEAKRGVMSRLLGTSAKWNGTMGSAKEMVEALTKLTEREDLQFLTLLPLAEVCSYNRLFRQTRAWCPSCFEMWREKGVTLYEPLLWCLEDVRICPVHRQCLQERCPQSDCARTSPPLTGRSQPGFCPWCNIFLGSPSHLSADLPSDEECQQQQWIATVVGEVLEAVPTRSQPLQREQALMVISSWVNEILSGSYAQAARQLGLTRSTVRQWLVGGKKPQMRNLLQVCFSLDISLFALLNGTAQVTSCRDVSLPQLPPEPTKRRPRRKFEARTLQKALEVAVHSPEDPPLSPSKLAKRLGYRLSFLSRQFPELCQALSCSYRAYWHERRKSVFEQRCTELDQVMSSLHSQGLYPSQHRMRPLLKKPNILRLPEIRRVWKTKLREMGHL